MGGITGERSGCILILGMVPVLGGRMVDESSGWDIACVRWTGGYGA